MRTRASTNVACGNTRGLILGLVALGAFLAGVVSTPARADEVTLDAMVDTTIYGSNVNNSNGVGAFFYAGRTQAGQLRRGLLAFDVAERIPAAALIQSVTLTVRVTRTPRGGTASLATLHALTRSWGEGTSNAGATSGGGGQGASATLGDATWDASLFDPGGTQTIPWDSTGGDFVAGASTSKAVNAAGTYSFTGAGLVSDVQAWVDFPDTNHGWILRGSEGSNGTAREFGSRQNGTPANRPTLFVEYIPEPGMTALALTSLVLLAALRQLRRSHYA